MAFVLTFSLLATMPQTAAAYGKPVLTFSDGDLDHVYFAGDTLSFSINNLLNIEFYTIRISFGLIDFNTEAFTPTDIFTSGLTDGTADDFGYYIERTVTASSALNSPVTGTIVTGLGNAAVGIKVFVHDTVHDTWVQYGSTDPDFFFPLADSSGNPLIVGVGDLLSAVSHVSFDPVLGSGSQATENLRDIDITFGKVIGTGITGTIAFEGLDLVTNSDELVDLDAGINMTPVALPDAGTLEQYTVGIDVASTLTFLADLGASVTVTSSSFDGCTKYDFKAVAASAGAGGAVSHLAFDDATDTVSFDVTHFSDYTLSLNNPDANSDGYYDPDVAALAVFLNQDSAVTDKSNGLVLSAGYNPEDPSTYVGFASWDTSTPKRLTGIDWSSGGLAGTLDASEFGKLTTLRINKTALTALDVSDCAALTYLSCSENDLTSLTLTGAANLERLYCYENKLESLSLTGLTKLIELYAEDNKLTTLTLTGLSELTTLNVANNLLTGLNISVNAKLNTIYCYGNRMRLSTLPVAAPSTYYDPQQTVSITLQNGNTVDLSDETLISTSSTTFTWYKATDASEITAGITESPTGVFTFSKSIYGGTAVYCVMSNAAFPGFTGNDALRTAAVTIQSAPTAVGGFDSESKTVNIKNKSGTDSISAIMTETGGVVRMMIGGDSFRTFVDKNKSDVIIDTGSAVVSFDSQAAGFIGKTAGSSEISLSVEKAKADRLSSLSAEELALIGDRPVYDFTLTVGGSVLSKWGGGHANISIPYTPKPGEDKNAIAVYYIDDAGKLQYVQGSYNDRTGTVDFTAEHFSLYAVGYNKLTFTDVADSAWYYNALTFCASRGITAGMGNNVFSPESSITRGQFIVMLMRSYGIEPDEKPADNFSDAGNSYYTGYLAAAKRLSISNGVGNNMYAPELELSRQDMFTLLYRTLNILGELPTINTGKTLADFSDSNLIADYAVTATEKLVAGGIVSGNQGQLSPGSGSTRAQMVQVLYKLLSV